MSSEARLYIAGMSLISACGPDLPMNVMSVKAGINRYQDSGYFSKDQQPIKMALVPNDALPEVGVEAPLLGPHSLWDKQLLKLASGGMKEAVANYQEDAPLPLVLACPEHYQQWPHKLPDAFIKTLQRETGAPIDVSRSRTIQTGRAGVIEALQMAQRYLYEAGHEFVLVGGVDSLQRPELFRGLLDYGRIAAGNGSDCFVPGEGAGFILVTRNKAKALKIQDHSVYLASPSCSEEPGHMYSEADYLGEGLSHAVTQSLSGFTGPKVRGVYHSTNGESFWAKELGVMLTRNAERIEEDFDVRHPADCYGDMGAASGVAMIALAAMDLLESTAYTSHLVCASSDHQYRGSVALSVDMQQENSEAVA